MLVFNSIIVPKSNIIKNGIIKGDFDDEILLKGEQIKHIPTQWDIGPRSYIKKFGGYDISHIAPNKNAKAKIS